MVGSDTTTTQSRLEGFTLLELLVVLVLAGALVAITPPLINRVVPSVKLKGASQEMSSALRFLRNWAISNREEGVFMLDLEQKSYRITPRERTYKVPDSSELTVISAAEESASEKQGVIRFYPDGSSTGGQISLRGSGDEYKIDVDWLTGRVSFVH
ncbi:MAG: GspH/FimT family protein [Candidatus Thiodiazotropha sp.]|jgi:general secretion pathway protein H